MPTIDELCAAAQEGDVAQVESLRAAAPELVNRTAPSGWTPLHLAADFGQVAAARSLLAHGADIHARATDDLHYQPLHAAVAGGQAGTVALLLDAGADPNTQRLGGWYPLHAAVDAGRVDLIELLVAHGAQINVREDAGITPLTMAQDTEHEAVAAWLRERGGIAYE